MNTTANRSSSSGCSCLVNPEALKVGETVAYSLILVVSLVGNSLSALIVYKTPTLRKPINIYIDRKHGHVRLSNIPVPCSSGSDARWLVAYIGGTLGQALCKIHTFLADVSS